MHISVSAVRPNLVGIQSQHAGQAVTYISRLFQCYHLISATYTLYFIMLTFIYTLV